MDITYDFNKKIEQLEKENPTQTSGWYKMQDGDNRMRILTTPSESHEHFVQGGFIGQCIGVENGCPACIEADTLTEKMSKEVMSSEQKKNMEKKIFSLRPKIKYLFWVIDRRDGQMKIAKLSYGIFKQIGKYQADTDYSFSSLPMPYDINIKMDSKAAPKDYYTVIPRPKREPISEAEAKEVAALVELDSIVLKMKDKKLKEIKGTKEEKSGVLEPAIKPEDYPTAEQEGIDPTKIDW